MRGDLAYIVNNRTSVIGAERHDDLKTHHRDDKARSVSWLRTIASGVSASPTTKVRSIIWLMVKRMKIETSSPDGNAGVQFSPVLIEHPWRFSDPRPLSHAQCVGSSGPALRLEGRGRTRSHRPLLLGRVLEPGGGSPRGRSLHWRALAMDRGP